MKTSVHIRQVDEEIYKKLSQLNFGLFISDMMQKHGQDYIDDKVEKQVKELNKLTS